MEVQACRVCLATETELHSFSENNVKFAFEDITSSTVDLNNGLPQHICDLCKTCILQVAEFRKWCQNVQGLLNTKAANNIQISKEFMKEIHSTFPIPKFFSTQIPEDTNDTKYCDEEYLDQDECGEYIDEEEIKEPFSDVEIEDMRITKNDTNIINLDIENEGSKKKVEYKALDQQFVETEETDSNTKANKVETEKVSITAFNNKKQTCTPKTDVVITVDDDDMPLEAMKGGKTVSCVDKKLAKSEKLPLKYKLHSTTITKIGSANVSTADAGTRLLRGNKQSFAEQRFKNIGEEKLRIKVEKWQCASCKYVFLSVEALERHLEICSDSYSPCGLCGANFQDLTRLFEHMAKEHNSISADPLVCFECNMEFKKEITLHRHWIHVHRGKVKRKRPKVKTIEKPRQDGVVCDQCGKQFKAQSHLRHHMTKHTGERPYQCDICHKNFRIEMTLRTHKFVHSGEKPFLCTVCSHAFRQPSHLRRHMRTHTGEKPYECSVCLKAFSTDWNRDEHVRTIHEGLPPKPRPGKLKKLHQMKVIQS